MITLRNSLIGGAVAIAMIGTSWLSGYGAGQQNERTTWEAAQSEKARKVLADASRQITDALARRQAIEELRATIAMQAAEIERRGAIVAPTPEIVYVEADTGDPNFECGWLRDAIERTDADLSALAGGADNAATSEPGAVDPAADTDPTGQTCTIADLMNWAATMETIYRHQMIRFVRLQREVRAND